VSRATLVASHTGIDAAAGKGFTKNEKEFLATEDTENTEEDKRGKKQAFLVFLCVLCVLCVLCG
jgi:hypothetical protein